MPKFFSLPYIKIMMRYGMLSGILGFVLLLGLYYMGRHPFLVPVFFDFRILLFGVLILFGLKEVRDYYQQGVLYFWQAMIGAFVFTILYASLSSLLLWGFALMVPDFVSSYVSLFQQQVSNFPDEVINQIGREAYENNLRELPTTKARNLAYLYFTQSYIISFFLSIILSVILRRQPKTP